MDELTGFSHVAAEVHEGDDDDVESEVDVESLAASTRSGAGASNVNPAWSKSLACWADGTRGPNLR